MSGAGDPLNVLFVSHYYPPHVGGIENVVHDEAVRLAELGHEVVVLTSGERSGETVEQGVRVVRVRAWYGIEHRTGIPYPIMSPSLARQALRRVRRADVVHIHDCFYLTSWSVYAAALLLRTPFVLTQHVAVIDHPSAAVKALQRLVYGTAGRLIVHRARSVFTINPLVASFVTGLGARPERIRLLDNGVDGRMFRPARDERERAGIRARYGLPPDRVLVLFVGRFVPKKGFDLVLGAAGPCYDLVMVGAGAPGPAVDGPGPADGPGAVHFLGSRSKEAVAELYRACDVFVLPSAAEGFPLVVQEAMSSGTAVVTSRDPAYERYGLEDGGVTLIERHTEAVRTALGELAGDEELRLKNGQAAAAYAAARFSWDEHVETLLAHYRSAAREDR